jgi:hypothetical protein
VAVERFRHRRTVVTPAAADQRGSADENARYAEATLHAPLENERLRQDAAQVVRHTLQRDDVAAGHLFGLTQARQRGSSVDGDEAAAARPLRRAAVFRREDAALLAQNLEKVHARLVGRLGGNTVQREVNRRHPRYGHSTPGELR